MLSRNIVTDWADIKIFRAFAPEPHAVFMNGLTKYNAGVVTHSINKHEVIPTDQHDTAF